METIDLRRRGGLRHAALLAACRRLMRQGDLQPSIQDIASIAGVSRMGVYYHFSPDGLRSRAASDPETRAAILARVLGDAAIALPDDVAERIVAAIVLGRVPV